MVGSAYRDYTVKVNVHKENGNEFTWNSNSVSGLELTTDQKFVNNNGNMFLFAVNGSSTVWYKYDGSQWSELNFNTSLNTCLPADQ